MSAEYVNALHALDNGWTGQGVLVGVIDDGVKEIDELKGQISPLSRAFAHHVRDGQRNLIDNVGDDTSDHGTPIAAIIAARRDGQGVMGLAPDVKIVSLRVDGHDFDTGHAFLGEGQNDAIRYAADNGIKIINRSLVKNAGGSFNAATANAVTYLKDRGGLLINSTGNDGGANPRDANDMTTDNREGWLFVGAILPNGVDYELASYSNACGVAMDRCVVAPGNAITVGVDNALTGFSGTSAAAPYAASLGAMILSKWPQLTGVDAGNIILNTAKDIGADGMDEIYGRGLIDVKAALSPVNPAVTNGMVSSSINNSVMVLGNAFGGGTASTQSSFTEALTEVTVLDAYGRDFSGDLTGMVVRAAGNDSPLRRRMEAQAHAGSTGFIMPSMSATLGWSAFETAHVDHNGERVLQNRLTNADFAVRLNNTTITAGFNSSDNVMDDILGLAPSSDVMFAYSPLAQTNFGASHSFGKTRLGMSFYHGENVDGLVAQIAGKAGTLKVGLVNESGTVFGTPVGSGAMRFSDGAQTAFAEVTAGFDHGPWSFDGYGSLGATRLKLSDDMLLTDASVITSARFGFTATRSALGGQMSFGMAQPLVALSGNGTVTIGSGYDLASRSLVLDNRKIDMRGEVKPQITFGFAKAVRHAAFRLGAASSLNAADVQAIGSWNVRF